MQSLSTWILLESLLKSFFFLQRQYLLSPFLRCSCLSLDRYYDPRSRLQARKGLNFQWKKQKKNAWLLLELLEKWLHYKHRRFEWFLFFIFYLILCNSFGTGKIEKLDFLDSSNSTNFKHQLLENQKYKNY